MRKILKFIILFSAELTRINRLSEIDLWLQLGSAKLVDLPFLVTTFIDGEIARENKTINKQNSADLTRKM